MATLLQISQLGRPVLRERAREVSDVHDPAIQHLIDDMIATCREVDGVGIAAPQVFRSLRVFVVASKPNARYPHAPEMEPLAVIDPVVVAASAEMETDWEGCLSVPGIRGRVPRHRSVTIAFTDRQGARRQETFTGFVARIVQHEFDHIEGKVFLDRTDPADLTTEGEYRRLVSQGPGR